MEKEQEFQVQSEYEKSYSEESLFEKIKKYAQNAGISVIYVVLLLYYALMRTCTPIWAKTTILGALGYFISPIDAIPDITPVLGYTDDFGVLMMALVTVSMFINDEVKTQAKSKLREWFGEYDQNSINDIESKLNKKKEANVDDK